MRNFIPLDLISAHPWQRATFTTYAFSASFVEAVLVEALMRQGVSDITIFTDPLGYRMALRERGAVRIGREYVVHPIAVPRGCFHPKLMVLEAEESTHVTVGSGNLTFGGWSANLECIEHLHTNGMSLAVGDVGRFFSSLAKSSACESNARDVCRSLGQRLQTAAAIGRDDGAVRVVNSLEGPIADRIVAAAEALGGAKSLTMASPYWDAQTLDRLASWLALPEVRAHVPPTRVPAPKDMDWPRGSATVRPVKIAEFVAGDASDRGLHAKMVEVVCDRGRVIVSGSANATSAGLLQGGETLKNVEVCVLRADRRPDRHWKFTSAKPPPKQDIHLEDDEGDANVGVLTATHVDGGIQGRILTNWRAESASVTIELNRRPIELGHISVVDRGFTVPVEQLENEELSLEGRIQIRLDAGDEVAEGFVSAPDFGAIRGRAGNALGSMMSVLKGMQTPEDVLAVMEFVRTHPEVLRTREAFRGRSNGGAPERPNPLVDAELVGRAQDGTEPDRSGQPPVGKGELAWQRFVARLMQSFAQATASTEDDEDEADRTEKVRRRRAAQARDKLELRFAQLFPRLLEGATSDAELVNLARLTHFVCVTTSHPATDTFLARLISAAKGFELRSVARDTFTWCIAYLAARGAEFDAAKARAKMSSLRIDPDSVPAQDCALPGLLEIIAPEADINAVLAAIRSTRTVHDDVRSLEAGLETGTVPAELGALPFHEAWPRLLHQCGREPAKRRIHFVDHPVAGCPACNIALLPELKLELARNGICESNCHGFILVRYA